MKFTAGQLGIDMLNIMAYDYAQPNEVRLPLPGIPSRVWDWMLFRF